MKQRTIQIAVVAFLLGLAAYWYWSPLLAVRGMKTAALAGDAVAFNEYIDYPRLRESLKRHLTVMVSDTVVNQRDAGLGGALGGLLGLALIDRMVDETVKPEVVMRSMSLRNTSNVRKAQLSEDAEGVEPHWESERIGSDTFILHVSEPNSRDKSRVSMVLERSGFATWKLTEMRMPQPAVEN